MKLATLLAGALASILCFSGPAVAFKGPGATRRSAMVMSTKAKPPFTDELYAAMRDTFSITAKRVKDGHLKRSDYNKLRDAIQLIVNDAEASLGKPLTQLDLDEAAAPADAEPAMTPEALVAELENLMAFPAEDDGGMPVPPSFPEPFEMQLDDEAAEEAELDGAMPPSDDEVQAEPSAEPHFDPELGVALPPIMNGAAGEGEGEGGEGGERDQMGRAPAAETSLRNDAEFLMPPLSPEVPSKASGQVGLEMPEPMPVPMPPPMPESLLPRLEVSQAMRTPDPFDVELMRPKPVRLNGASAKTFLPEEEDVTPVPLSGLIDVEDAAEAVPETDLKTGTADPLLIVDSSEPEVEDDQDQFELTTAEAELYEELISTAAHLSVEAASETDHQVEWPSPSVEQAIEESEPGLEEAAPLAASSTAEVALPEETVAIADAASLRNPRDVAAAASLELESPSAESAVEEDLGAQPEDKGHFGFVVPPMPHVEVEVEAEAEAGAGAGAQAGTDADPLRAELSALLESGELESPPLEERADVTSEVESPAETEQETLLPPGAANLTKQETVAEESREGTASDVVLPPVLDDESGTRFSAGPELEPAQVDTALPSIPAIPAIPAIPSMPPMPPMAPAHAMGDKTEVSNAPVASIGSRVPHPTLSPMPPQQELARQERDPKLSLPRDQDEVDAQNLNRGYGIAHGTRNTYIIEGMEDMTPQEYRLAMNRKIVSERNRRVRQGGPIGNLAFHDYMRELQGDHYDGPMNFDPSES